MFDLNKQFSRQKVDSMRLALHINIFFYKTYCFFVYVQLRMKITGRKFLFYHTVYVISVAATKYRDSIVT